MDAGDDGNPMEPNAHRVAQILDCLIRFGSTTAMTMVYDTKGKGWPNHDPPARPRIGLETRPYRLSRCRADVRNAVPPHHVRQHLGATDGQDHRCSLCITFCRHATAGARGLGRDDESTPSEPPKTPI